MPTLGNALDFAKYEARNLRGHQLGTAPATPVTGQLYYNTADNTLYWYDGSQWVSARGGAAATPPATTTSLGTVQLAGDLTGTATSPQIAAAVITDAEVAAANKDGAAGTPSLRTLGTGATQAAPGNDSRFTAPSVPTAHATTHQPGGADPMAVDAAAATGSLRSLGMGALQGLPGNTPLNSITAPGAPVSMNGQRVTSVADPSASTDAANKQYVDGVVQGLDAKASVRVATTANITLSATQTIDGIVVAVNDRVLVKNQTTASQNGIYSVQSAAWTRTTDLDTWAEFPSAYVWVETGTANADTGWLCTNEQGGVLDSTAVTWVQFSGAGQVIAGAGLTKTGNTIDVIGTVNRILVAADQVDIAGTYVGQASITTLGTVTTGTWNGTTIAVANGGTGQTTQKAARETGLAATGYYSSATHAAGTSIAITQATHLLRATRGLLVQVQEEATGAVVIPDIVVAANGDVTVTFGASVAANAYRVTIIG